MNQIAPRDITRTSGYDQRIMIYMLVQIAESADGFIDFDTGETSADALAEWAVDNLPWLRRWQYEQRDSILWMAAEYAAWIADKMRGVDKRTGG